MAITEAAPSTSSTRRGRAPLFTEEDLAHVKANPGKTFRLDAYRSASVSNTLIAMEQEHRIHFFTGVDPERTDDEGNPMRSIFVRALEEGEEVPPRYKRGPRLSTEEGAQEESLQESEGAPKRSRKKADTPAE